MKTRNVPRPAPLMVPSSEPGPVVSSDFVPAIDLETCEELSPSCCTKMPPGTSYAVGPTSPSYSPGDKHYHCVDGPAPPGFRHSTPPMSPMFKRNLANYCSVFTEWLLRNKKPKVETRKNKTTPRPSTKKKGTAKSTK